MKQAADDLVRSVCDRALAGIHRLTLDQLAAAASERRLLADGRAPITRIVREALAAKIANQAADENRLLYFKPVARMRGFAPALARTLSELRLESITAERLRALSDCGEDLALLLELYEAELRAGGFADRAHRFRVAEEEIGADYYSLAGKPVLLLGLSLRFRLERELLRSITDRATEVLALNLHHDREDMEQLLGVSAESLVRDAATPLASLQQGLFRKGATPPQTPDSSFAIYSASGESLECVEIARRIAQFAGQGIRFDEMAVLLRRPERYGPMVNEAFRRAGIQGYFAQSARRPDPAGRALLSLLHCAAERLSASRFTEYLSLDQVPEASGSSLGWERLIVRANVIEGDEKRWADRLETLSLSLQRQYSQCEEEGDRLRIDRQGSSLAALRDFSLPLLRRLSALPQNGLWGEWLQTLAELTDLAVRDTDSAHALLEQMQPMANIGPVTLAAVLSTLEDWLRFDRQASQQERYGRVFVGSIDDARGMSFRVVFLPSLNEGSFPAQFHEDPLLLDGMRARLGIESAADDSELLRSAVAAAKDHIILSYSRIDLVSGRVRVPSFYVFEAYKAALGESPDVQQLQREAREAVETRADWPAPINSEVAIDDMEWDLAQLKPAFENGVAGAGAYLNDVNPYAVHSLRDRYRRWSRQWRYTDGVVDLDEEARRQLESYRPDRYAWSPSALEQFAICPYRFALRGIFKLNPRQTPAPAQSMDPAVRGEIFHRTVAALVRDLREIGQLPLTSDNLEEAGQVLDDILDRVAAVYAAELAPAIPSIWSAEVERLRTDLKGWLRNSAAAGDWTPLYSEWSFGLAATETRDDRSVPEPVQVLGKYLLRGSVDLIEQHQHGALRIVDLKTGALPKKKPKYIGSGEVLQPALYALAAESALGRSVPGARLEYATLRQNYTAIEIPLPPARAAAARVLQVIDEWTDKGFLPAAPREDACNSCEFVPICGPYEEERIQRKPRTELQDLKRIRGTE